jgi:hypothetical protein
MAVQQYMRLPENHPVKKHLESDKQAVVKGTGKDYELSVSYNRTLKNGKRSGAWYGIYSWPRLHCTCNSWKFGNHPCTKKMENEGREPEITKAGELRLCKHWINAIRNPDSVERYEDKPVKKSGSGSSGSRSSGSKSSGSNNSKKSLTRAIDLFNAMPDNDDVKQALQIGDYVSIQGSTDTYRITKTSKGILCTCLSYKNGSHRVGTERNAYRNEPREWRLCKHTLELFTPRARKKNNWEIHSSTAEL